MSICASGASTTKAGVPAAVVVDQAYIQSLLPAGLAWAYPYLPFMHGLQVGDVGAFCALDPPTFTVPTAGQIFSFVTGGPLSEVQAVNDFLNLVTQMYLWYQLCQCTTGATPAAPAPPAAPANLPAVNPSPYVSLGPGVPCIQFDSVLTNVSDSNSFLTGTPTLTGFAPTTIVVKVNSILVTAPQCGWAAELDQITDHPSTVTLRSDTWTETGATGQTVHTIPMDPKTERLHFSVIASGCTGVSSEQTHFDVYCNGSSPVRASPCCPQSAIDVGKMDQILQLVTLIQRQSAPFAYLLGTAHAGLSGNGQFAVQGLIGIKVSVTTVPGRAGLVVGDPNTLFGLGWVQVGTADGFGDRMFIDSNPDIMLPLDMGAMTLVGYSIPPDVVVTITELVREP
jgi:hypothetical protein